MALEEAGAASMQVDDSTPEEVSTFTARFRDLQGQRQCVIVC